MNRTLILIASLITAVAFPGGATAHTGARELAFYGPFPVAAGRCQRVIARAAERCVAATVRSGDTCTLLGLGVCETGAGGRIESVHAQARARIQAACDADQASLLQFGTVGDAQRDADQVCTDLGRAAMSAAYGPALAGSAAGAESSACVAATAAAVSRLVVITTRAWRSAFNRIVSHDYSPSQKLALVARAHQRLERARARIAARLRAACPAVAFEAVYGRDIDTLLNALQRRADCFAGTMYAQAAVICPAPVCGNGVREGDEECDDGNADDGDTCRTTCESNVCASYPSTFALLQAAIFERHGCTDRLCHGSAAQNDLDLRADVAYANLVNRPSFADQRIARVVPGDEKQSLLYLKLAAKTLGEPAAGDLPGAPMPLNLTALDTNAIDALRRWIRGGAPRTGVVEGTAGLLNACLPPPDPVKIPPPEPPAPDAGTLIAMPGWPLGARSEAEVCVASYYDLSAPGAVPAEHLVDCDGRFPGTNDSGSNAGKCFTYDSQDVTQDGQGHHLIEYIYRGVHDYTDAGWGPWTCYGGDRDGELCDPALADACGGGVCGSKTSRDKGCSYPDFGPPGFVLSTSSEFLGLAMEPVSNTTFPAGVYSILPLKGIVVWDSHAFNLTAVDTTMQAWSLHRFAKERQRRGEFLFLTDYLYTQDVPPFETREYCATKTFTSGTNAFSIRSHYHKRGRRFRIWGPPQTPCGSGGPAPVGPGLRVDPACLPGDPSQLLYESFDYSDPVHLVPQPPLQFSGDVEQRTIKYCALYDNGATRPEEVKRASTSPPISVPGEPGGPCAPSERKCLSGPNVAQPCGGDDANCPQSVCDACNLRGGSTSDDEMFGVAVYTFRGGS